MGSWMVKCGEVVQPLDNLLIDHLHKQLCLHVEETTLHVLYEPGKTVKRKSYVWIRFSTGLRVPLS